MDDEFRRKVLLVVALYIFISFALDEGDDENDNESILPFGIPNFE